MNLSKKLARGGIFAALGVIMLYMTAMAPTGKLFMYFMTALPVSFIIVETGLWAGVLVYLTISLVSFLMVGPLAAMPFVLFFGHYAVFKCLIEKGRNAIVEIAMKLAVFNISGAIAYFVYIGFLGATIQVMPLAPVYMGLIIIAAQFLFFIYDYTYTMMIDYYREKIKPKLF